MPVPARRACPGPGARRLRGLAVAEARLRPAPPPPGQEVQRAPPRAASGLGADVPPPRRVRGVPGRVRGAVRRPHPAPPRGPVRAVRPRHRAVGGGGRGPRRRHGRGRAVRGEVPGGGVRGERREVRSRGARARGVPRRGDARRRVPVGGGDAREGRARRRVGQLRHGDRLRPRGRRRRHLHRRPQRASPGDQGDLERGDGAVPVPAGVGHRQAGAAHVRRRVRRHVQARPPPPRRGALHHEAHNPGLPRRRRRHLRQDQDRRDPGAPRRRQERPRERRRVRGRETIPLRRHRLRHRLPEHRHAVAQERGRADRRRRDGGGELSGALEGGERAVLRRDGAEGHLRQLRGRGAHRRRHQQAAASPAGAGAGQRLLAPAFLVRVCGSNAHASNGCDVRSSRLADNDYHIYIYFIYIKYINMYMMLCGM